MSKPKKFVFVLMPFDNSFNDVYTYGIKQTCIELNTYCERVDEQIFNERILDRIYNQISKADILIADMTNRNANVFYEVGYAHGLGKDVILLTKNSDDIPFDLKHFPHIIYNGQIKILSDQLKRKLEWFIEENKQIDKRASEFTLQFLINGEVIEEGKRIEIEESQKESWENTFKVKIDVCNSSTKTFSSKFTLGLETSKKNQAFIGGLELVKPSSETVLYISKDFSNIYPRAYKSLIFELKDIRTNKEPVTFDFKLKVFTSFELREVNFSLMLPQLVDIF